MTNNTPATQTDNAPDRGIQTGASSYTPEQRDRLRAVQNLGEASDADLDVLFAVADRSGLDPMLKEIYLVGRRTKTGGYRGEPERWETVWTVQTGIDGFRKVTHRYAASQGTHVEISRPTFYDDEGRPRPFWSKKYGDHPEAAEVTVSVGSSSSTHIVTWDEYVQTKAEYRNGKKTGNQVPNNMWEQYGPTMLAKCAEAGAHRRVCPLTSGMYVPEELQGNRAAYTAQARRLDGNDTTQQRDDDTAAALAALTQAVTNSDMNLSDTITKPQGEKQPAAAPNNAQNPPQQQQQQAQQPQGREYPWPPRLDTGDDNEDQRLYAIIENEIKAAKTRDDLQKLYDEFNSTFSGLHNETFTAALNARSEDIANGTPSPRG